MGATFVAAQARWEIQQWGQLLEAQALLLQPGVSTTGSPPDHGMRAEAIGGKHRGEGRPNTRSQKGEKKHQHSRGEVRQEKFNISIGKN